MDKTHLTHIIIIKKKKKTFTEEIPWWVWNDVWNNTIPTGKVTNNVTDFSYITVSVLSLQEGLSFHSFPPFYKLITDFQLKHWLRGPKPVISVRTELRADWTLRLQIQHSPHYTLYYHCFYHVTTPFKKINTNYLTLDRSERSLI